MLLLKPIWNPIVKALLIALLPFIIGGFIAYLLHPLVEKLDLLGLNRIASLSIIYLLFFGGTGYLLYLIIPVFIDQMKHFSDHMPQLVGHYKGWVRDIDQTTSRWPDGMQNQIEERMIAFEEWLNQSIEKGFEVIMALMNFAFVFALVPIISFYLLKDLDHVNKVAWYITPSKWRNKAKEFLSAVNVSLGGYIRGQFIVCVLIGVVATIAFWILDIKYPILLGTIIAFTNIIPYFGPIIGAIPVMAIAILSSVKQAVLALIIILVLQFLEGNFISPYIVGKSIDMHPLFIIAALIIGGEVAGIIGMIIAVPLLAILKIAIIHSRDHLIRTNQS